MSGIAGVLRLDGAPCERSDIERMIEAIAHRGPDGVDAWADYVNNSCKPATDGRMCSPCINNDDCRNGAHPEDRCIVNNCDSCPYKGEAFCSTPCADDAACVSSFGPGFVCKLWGCSDPSSADVGADR